MACYDLGRTWEEFGDLTPSMFTALCKRRNIKMKHERFANGLTAAAVYNVSRTRPESETVTAYDFIRDEKDSEARAQRQTLKRQIKEAVGRLPLNATRAQCLKVRESIIAGMVALGRTDAAELWSECWPDLMPD